MTKIFVHIDSTTSSYYRAILPVSHCYHELSCKGIKLVGDFQPADGEIFDVYIFNRVIKPDFWEYIQQLIQMGKKIIWQTDDDLWNIPSWNPASYKVTCLDINILGEIVKYAHSLVFSTDYLANAANCEKSSLVLPNLIDCTDFSPYRERNNTPLKILWTGSFTHDEDLKQIIDATYRVIDKYKTDVQFIFWGYYPVDLFHTVEDGFLKRYEPKHKDNVAFLNWMNGKAYFDVLDKLKPDIALAPLEDCHFNKCKSSLKSLEMIMAGAAFVGSKLTPYEWIEHGVTGLLTKADNWFENICYLIDNPRERKIMVLKGQEKIRESFSWQSSGRNLWMKAFESF